MNVRQIVYGSLAALSMACQARNDTAGTDASMPRDILAGYTLCSKVANEITCFSTDDARLLASAHIPPAVANPLVELGRYNIIELKKQYQCDLERVPALRQIVPRTDGISVEFLGELCNGSITKDDFAAYNKRFRTIPGITSRTAIRMLKEAGIPPAVANKCDEHFDATDIEFFYRAGVSCETAATYLPLFKSGSMGMNVIDVVNAVRERISPQDIQYYVDLVRLHPVKISSGDVFNFEAQIKAGKTSRREIKQLAAEESERMRKEKLRTLFH